MDDFLRPADGCRDLHFDGVSLLSLAREHGTPLYVYSASEIASRYRQLVAALGARPHLVCYSVKANSNLGVLSLLAGLGCGFDIVSGGELARVLAAGGRADRVVFSGVGKTAAEIRQALQAGIHCFNVESEGELARISAVAGALGVVAPVSLRVNPDVDPETHPYISTGLRENKFGVDIARAPAVYQIARELPHLRIVGLDCHIGSQLLKTKPFGDAVRRLLALLATLRDQGVRLEHVDIGGGVGVRYRDEIPPTFAEYVREVDAALGPDFPYTLVVEPGRSLVANAGLLLARVEYVKATLGKRFAVVDAAMNDLIRPALYQSYHEILALPAEGAAEDGREEAEYDVVGPVCESADFLGKGRRLAVAAGDLVVVKSAGAYGFSMSFNYNSRPRAAEVLVHRGATQLVRPREEVAALFATERVCEIFS